MHQGDLEVPEAAEPDSVRFCVDSESQKQMNQTYVTDLTHFLDDHGEVPKEAPAHIRQMASFLALIVDSVTSQIPETTSGIETGIRCRSTGCQGLIVASVDDYESPVNWDCMECGDRGTISNWQTTKWDNVRP